jgi:polyphenol oxidase
MLGEPIADQEATSIVVIRAAAWEQYTWLRHGFSSRAGGVSSVYGRGSLNLGWTKEDNPAFVTENRRRFLDAVTSKADGGTSFALVTERQIHSAISHVIREQDEPFSGKLPTPEGKAILEGDGLMTNLSGIMLGVGTADCVPVLVADVKNRAVAAFHAGWRGTAARIVEHGIAKMTKEYGSHPADLIAAIGPSIGSCCYAIGEEVRTAFATQFDYADNLFHENYLDLWKANRRQLLDAGLRERQITVIGECTACTRDSNGELRYFSHRGEHGVAGRMLNIVGTVRE